MCGENKTSEEIINEIVLRAIEIRKSSQKKAKEMNLLLDVAGFKVKDAGDGEIPPTYTHKDHLGIVFETDDETYEARKYDKKGTNYKEMKSAALTKLCKFIDKYNDIRSQIFLDGCVDEHDYVVGKYIDSVELEDVMYKVTLKGRPYLIDMSFWIEKREEANVFFILEQYKEVEKFWETCDTEIQKHEERMKKFKEFKDTQ